MALSVFSIASLIIISVVYIDFQRDVRSIVEGWPDYFKLTNSHPGGAIQGLLNHVFYFVNGGNNGRNPFVKFNLFPLLFLISLLSLSSFFIYKIVWTDAHNRLFVISGILNAVFYLVILLGLLNIYVECHPNPTNWCGFFGGIAVAIGAIWFLLFSVLFLMIDSYKKYRDKKG
jgi:hypothetical protein